MNQKSNLTLRKVFERFSYGCGDFGCNIIYTAMSAFLLFYYTDYAGVSDIIMGVIVDRTKSKFGKARPWILRMCIPFAVSGILLFSVPVNWAPTPKLVYVFITYNLVSTIIYTATNVPFLVGLKALFKNKYWIMMTLMLALFFLMYSVNGGATVYYAKDILGDKNLVATINGIFNVVQIFGMLILNFSGGAMSVIVISSIIRGIGNACGGATMWAMVSDTIDYGEWKTGYRTEGLVNSACSFGYKIGNGIGSAAVQTSAALT